MQNDIETLGRLWPHLSDGQRETVLKFALHAAKANGFREPSPTVFVVESSRPKLKREPLGVDWGQQQRAKKAQRELYGPEDIPF
jgi:hypothetical protein